ncbi:MAG: cold shock domain-containing protein [Alphaproteobacteria bacterium]|nr:MAG: cold shock domain-containing protein [Alphaproteobacteria bacterium]
MSQDKKQNDIAEAGGEVVRGHVKWFDVTKGFGFVVADEGGPDILLHANVLRNYGQSSVADGSGIEIVVQDTPRGMQAARVLRITPPQEAQSRTLTELEGLAEEIAETPLVPARVKWFDKVKGFGFANAFGSAEDVFIHIEILRRSGFSDLTPGEAVCLRIVEGRRGKMAVAVTGWEAAVEERGQDTPEKAPE